MRRRQGPHTRKATTASNPVETRDGWLVLALRVGVRRWGKGHNTILSGWGGTICFSDAEAHMVEMIVAEVVAAAGVMLVVEMIMAEVVAAAG